MAYTNKTEHILADETASFDGAVGIYNHSNGEIYYSFSSFSESVNGIRIEPYGTVDFPLCAIHVKTIGHSADVEIVKG